MALTGFKRRMGEKIREFVESVVFFCLGFKVAPGANEFFQVLNARDGFFAAFFAVMVYKTAAADGEIYFFRQVMIGGVPCQLFNQGNEGA